MKIRLQFNLLNLLVLLAVVLFWSSLASAQGTAFTYQGRLEDNGVPANNSYDFHFLVFDAENAGIQQGVTLLRAGVAVSNGLFTTTLDFGADTFNGSARWLEIQVSPANLSDFITLTPRQALTPTPYALYASNASTAASATSVSWLALTGVPGGLADGVDDNTLYSAGDGLSLVGTIFSLDTTFADARYWKLTGNAGTTPDVNFLGTTDNQALELKVNNARALRLEPAADSPNVIGGFGGNYAAAGISGATIGGGGHEHLNGTNVVRASYGTIGGGLGNSLDALRGVVAGGAYNFIRSNATHSVIAGGLLNEVRSNAQYSVIGGGRYNLVGQNADYATVGGGRENFVSADGAFIGGGTNNGAYAASAMIGGGDGNDVLLDALSSAIAGGSRNQIGPDARHSFIGGGHDNSIRSNAWYAVIGGGESNSVLASAVYSTIGGGRTNVIHASATNAVIAGGNGNQTWSVSTAVSGGRDNSIEAVADGSVIGGGATNIIRYNASYTTIAGGTLNVVETNSDYATIPGGYNNAVELGADYATIGGGANNAVEADATYGTISGGSANVIATNADYATIPGGRHAQASHYGQHAYASGRFVTTGDAQTSVYVVRRTTSNATQSELYLDGATLRLTVPDGSTWAFEVLVVARSSTGDSAGYRLTGVVENVGGVMAGTFQAPQILREDVAAWEASAAVDNVNDALIIQVTGAVATTIRWVATVRTTEVSF